MILSRIVTGVRRATASGGLRPLLASAAVAVGIAQLQSLASEARDTAEAAQEHEKILRDHVALLQAQISDLEGQALNSVRAAIASGLYDDAVQARVETLQRAAATLAREHNEQHQKTPYPGCPRCASDSPDTPCTLGNIATVNAKWTCCGALYSEMHAPGCPESTCGDHGDAPVTA